MRTLATRNLDVADLTDSSGELRVRLLLPTWDDYLRTGVEDLLTAGAQFAMVLKRIRQLLASLIDLSPPPAHVALVQLLSNVDAKLTRCAQPLAAGATRTVP